MKKIFICGPRLGRGGYAESVEHDMAHLRRRRSIDGCLFCEMERRPGDFELVGGEWRAKTPAAPRAERETP